MVAGSYWQQPLQGTADPGRCLSGGYNWIKGNNNDFDPSDNILGSSTDYGFGEPQLSGRYRFFSNKE
jgi:hypothetical protein